MDWKKKIAAVVFLLVLVCVPVAAFLLPDQAVFKTERRKLAKKPAFTVAAFWDGTYMEQLETYFSEQFPVRDGLRTVKAETETALLGKADTNGYFKVEDGIYHLEAELNEKNVGRVADSIEKLCTEQFQNADCYVAVIPDKNYYLADKQYPILDYARLDEMIQAEIPSAQKINLYDKLHLEDYYRTDLHWKQEKNTGVVDALVQSMGQQTNTISDGWQIATEDFVGAYGAASAWKTTPDTDDLPDRSVHRADAGL